jgi:hypothetical protein
MHSHLPWIGIFYVIGVNLYVESIPMIEGEECGNFKMYPNGHIEYWAVLTKQLKLSSCLSYDFYPSGRVRYVKAQDTYKLYLDRCLVKPTNDTIDQEGTVPIQSAGRAIDR